MMLVIAMVIVMAMMMLRAMTMMAMAVPAMMLTDGCRSDAESGIPPNELKGLLTQG